MNAAQTDNLLAPFLSFPKLLLSLQKLRKIYSIPEPNGNQLRLNLQLSQFLFALQILGKWKTVSDPSAIFSGNPLEIFATSIVRRRRKEITFEDGH